MAGVRTSVCSQNGALQPIRSLLGVSPSVMLHIYCICSSMQTHCSYPEASFPARRSKYGDVDCWLREANPGTDLRTLVSCSLLSVDAEGRFAMHDQLRDLAYAIVRSEGRIAKRSRLRGQDAAALLQEQVLTSPCACSHPLYLQWVKQS